MAGESSRDTSRDTGEGQVEGLIDELIRDIFKEPGGFSESSMRGVATTAALFETAFGPTRGGSKVSVLEKLVLAEAFAAELAEMLAPALADQLAPRLIKAMEHVSAGEGGNKHPAGASSPGGQARKPDTK